MIADAAINDNPVVILPVANQVKYEIPIKDVVILRKVVPWVDEFIADIQALDAWSQSPQLGVKDHKYGINDMRSSQSLYFSSHIYPKLAHYELGLTNAFHNACKLYLRYNGFLSVNTNTNYEILRYKEGQQFVAHVDTASGYDGEEAQRQLSALLYLNDDYDGGELEFVRDKLKIKPGKGDIVMFPSNFCFPHTAHPVTNGIKFAVVTWFYRESIDKAKP